MEINQHFQIDKIKIVDYDQQDSLTIETIRNDDNLYKIKSQKYQDSVTNRKKEQKRPIEINQIHFGIPEGFKKNSIIARLAMQDLKTSSIQHNFQNAESLTVRKKQQQSDIDDSQLNRKSYSNSKQTKFKKLDIKIFKQQQFDESKEIPQVQESKQTFTKLPNILSQTINIQLSQIQQKGIHEIEISANDYFRQLYNYSEPQKSYIQNSIRKKLEALKSKQLVTMQNIKIEQMYEDKKTDFLLKGRNTKSTSFQFGLNNNEEKLYVKEFFEQISQLANNENYINEKNKYEIPLKSIEDQLNFNSNSQIVNTRICLSMGINQMNKEQKINCKKFLQIKKFQNISNLNLNDQIQFLHDFFIIDKQTCQSASQFKLILKTITNQSQEIYEIDNELFQYYLDLFYKNEILVFQEVHMENFKQFLSENPQQLKQLLNLVIPVSQNKIS